MGPALHYVRSNRRSSSVGSFTPLEDEDRSAVFEDHHHGGLSCLETLRRSRMFTLVILTLVVVLLFADQNLLAPNLSAIAEEFHFDEQEKDTHLGGDIAIAFFGFGAPSSLLIGWLTDVVDRRKLFVAVVLVGELGALATLFVTSFSQLFWTRAVTGVAIGGGMPLVYSIWGDLVASTGRTEASGLIGVSIGFGQGMGQVVAGFTGSSTSLGWRLPFLLVALPCLVLTALVFVATRDPPRGRREAGLQEHFRAGGEYKERISLRGLCMLASSPTVLLVLAQGIPGCIPWGVITVYLPDFLHKQRGLSIEMATVVGVVFGVATVAGQLLGAKMGQNLYNRSARLQPLLMGATTLAGTLPCILMIRYSGGHFAPYVLYASTGGVLAACTGPNVRSVLMNVTLPSTRGTAFGIFNLFDDLGKGLGPALISFLVVRRGRESALTIATLCWLACGSMLLAMALSVDRDELKVQTHLSEYGRTSLRKDSSSASAPLSSSEMPPSGGGASAAAGYAVVVANDLSGAADDKGGAVECSPFSREEQGGGVLSGGGRGAGGGIGDVIASKSDQPRRQVLV
ncbi:unnamed protein product [Pylaiella littoralis]